MKIGVTASCFDLLHAGHIAMLKESKDHCDYLICCLQVDPRLDRPEKNTGCELDMPIFYNARKHSFSSSDLRKRIGDSWE